MPCGYAGAMAIRRTSPLADIDENDIEVGHVKKAAAGVPAVDGGDEARHRAAWA